MTPQERTMLEDLIRRVQTTNLTEKDPDAQNLLDQQLGGHRDALYILAQTVLVQNYALEQAKRQMDELKQLAQSAAAQPAKATSFLGSIFGHQDKPAPPPQQAYPPFQQQYAQGPPATQWTPVQGGAPGYGAPAYGAAQGYPPGAQPGGGSSFLRSAATTAAGVAAGALAFQGVESLMHGFGHEAGFGGGGGLMGGGTGETVVNNYYDSPGGEDRGGDRGGDGFDRTGDDYSSSRDMPPLDDAGFTGPQDTSELQPEVDQADGVNVTDDSGTYDDASVDDGGSDDFGGGGDDSSFV